MPWFTPFRYSNLQNDSDGLLLLHCSGGQVLGTFSATVGFFGNALDLALSGAVKGTQWKRSHGRRRPRLTGWSQKDGRLLLFHNSSLGLLEDFSAIVGPAGSGFVLDCVGSAPASLLVDLEIVRATSLARGSSPFHLFSDFALHVSSPLRVSSLLQSTPHFAYGG